MTTVPNTSFIVDREDFKLALNLIDSATKSLRGNNRPAALRYAAEARDIISRWDRTSLAGNLYRRMDEAVKKIESA